MPETEAGRDDGELIRLCLSGEQAAFDDLAARHYRRVYSVVYRMLGNREEAEDVTQETFLRVYSRLDTFRHGASFAAWVRRIASNLCIDHLRRRREQNVSLDQQLESGVEQADESAGSRPDEKLEMAEDTRRVLEAMEELPPKQRAVLVLRHVEGLKIDEIAETLKMPQGTVKTMLFRGRQAVREMVGEL
jgi:RNA polymerase sigma-70 factor (ECF subfamily)